MPEGLVGKKNLMTGTLAETVEGIAGIAVGPYAAAGGEKLGDEEKVPTSAAVQAAYFCLHS